MEHAIHLTVEDINGGLDSDLDHKRRLWRVLRIQVLFIDATLQSAFVMASIDRKNDFSSSTLNVESEGVLIKQDIEICNVGSSLVLDFKVEDETLADITPESALNYET